MKAQEFKKNKKMIKINDEFKVEYQEELNEEITKFSILIGDSIKGMNPFEKFYALKTVLEELDSRITMYTIMDKLAKQNISDIKNKN